MKKILTVDDEAAIVQLFSKILSREGYAVITATSGKECLVQAREQHPDLILLDVNMPGKDDGGQVAQDLRDDARTKDIPIVFLTGIVSEREVNESHGMIAGRAFISKFSEPAEIVRKVKEIVPT